MPRETDPIPVRSSEVSRVEPTSAMVTRSRAREGRGISVIPETEFRPETEVRPETEIQVSMSTTCEGGLGAARPSTTDTASQYVTADKPEATATFRISPETNPNSSTASQTAPSHITIAYLVSAVTEPVADMLHRVRALRRWHIRAVGLVSAGSRLSAMQYVLLC